VPQLEMSIRVRNGLGICARRRSIIILGFLTNLCAGALVKGSHV
jgi:hypothetical protein